MILVLVSFSLVTLLKRSSVICIAENTTLRIHTGYTRIRLYMRIVTDNGKLNVHGTKAGVEKNALTANTSAGYNTICLENILTT